VTRVDRAPTVWGVLTALICHPIEHFVRGWNWKSATVSSACRATLFFAVNLPAGLEAGLRAMATEMAFRAVASGALGSATQAFRTATPSGTATIAALLVIPATGHLAEYTVHWLSGTARLGESIAVSVAFSVLTTAFNLFAMRRGALIVGDGEQTLAADVRRMPGLIVAFVRAIVAAASRFFTRLGRRSATRGGGRPPDGGTCLFPRCT
jgi:hypothetical protein